MTRGTLALLPAVVICGCAPVETNVGKAKLADADFTVAAPDKAPLLEVLPGAALAPVPKGPVRLAVDRDVSFRQVVDTLAAVRSAGGEPFILVARRDNVEAMPPWSGKAAGEAIKLKAKPEGKACVSPPDSEEATCVARKDHLHIDRAFVRQLLWQAVKEYDLQRIHVTVDPSLTWGDAVRAIDGARTCCGELKGLEVTAE